MAHSLLMIPVPPLASVVPDAHVTVLGPFAPLEDLTDGLLGELDELFGDVTPFRFRLDRLSQFPGGTVYLAPEPPTPFRSLTHALYRRFPEYPPYAGQFDDVVPHVSVAPGGDPDVVRQRLAHLMPLDVHAREAALVWWEDGGARLLRTFPFGTSAA